MWLKGVHRARCRNGAVKRGIMDDNEFAGIGLMDIELDCIDIQLKNITKAGKGVFGPEIAGATMAGDQCHCSLPVWFYRTVGSSLSRNQSPTSEMDSVVTMMTK